MSLLLYGDRESISTQKEDAKIEAESDLVRIACVSYRQNVKVLKVLNVMAVRSCFARQLGMLHRSR